METTVTSLSGRPEADPRAQPGGSKTLWIALALVLAAVLGYELLQWPGFRLREVEVSGLRLRTAGQVLREAGLRYQVPIWQVRPSGIAARLERDPVIEGATVRILWPDRLSIRIVERSPVAAVSVAGGGTWWVDRYGVPFLERNRTAGLPLIRLPGDVRPVAGRPLGSAAARPVALAALLAGAEPPLESVDVHGDGGLTLWLRAADGGGSAARRIPVWVDVASPPSEVARELLGVLAEARRRGQLPLYVDLRAPGLPAVAWPPRPPALAPASPPPGG